MRCMDLNTYINTAFACHINTDRFMNWYFFGAPLHWKKCWNQAHWWHWNWPEREPSTIFLRMFSKSNQQIISQYISIIDVVQLNVRNVWYYAVFKSLILYSWSILALSTGNWAGLNFIITKSISHALRSRRKEPLWRNFSWDR